MDRAENDKLEWVEWIKTQRIKRGWSQQLLADKVGTTRQTINDYEQYRRVKYPDENILAQISLVFGEADDYLVRLGGYMPQNKKEDQWLKRMNAKLRRVPARNREAVDKVIESFAEEEIAPREIRRRTAKQ